MVRVAGPPEAGFAGREAHVERHDHHPRRRLLTRQKDGFMVEEGAHGGTRGFPVPSAIPSLSLGEVSERSKERDWKSRMG